MKTILGMTEDLGKGGDREGRYVCARGARTTLGRKATCDQGHDPGCSPQKLARDRAFSCHRSMSMGQFRHSSRRSARHRRPHHPMTDLAQTATKSGTSVPWRRRLPDSCPSQHHTEGQHRQALARVEPTRRPAGQECCQPHRRAAVLIASQCRVRRRNLQTLRPPDQILPVNLAPNRANAYRAAIQTEAVFRR
jgi:hypothetical protein